MKRKYLLAKNWPSDKARVEIARETAQQILIHKKNLIRGYVIEERFDNLLANYAEFESEILARSLNNLLHRPRTDVQYHEIRIALSRRIMNLLSSCRAYFDQSSKRIKAAFGSKELGAIKKACSKEYDSSFSYRLMEVLRNQSQHVGSASDDSSVMNTVTRRGKNPCIASTVTPRLVKKRLMEDPRACSKLAGDLPSQPDVIDLTGHVRSYMDSIIRIHSATRELLSQGYQEWEATIEDAILTYRSHAGSENEPIGLTLFVVQDLGSLSVVEKEPIFRGLIERRTYLEKRNTVVPDLSRFFVTGQEPHLIETADVGLAPSVRNPGKD